MIDAGVQALLERYVDAFIARDGPRIANFYHIPSMTIRADGSFHTFESREEVADFLANVAQGYYDEGLRKFEMKDLEVKMIGTGSALISLEWRMNRDDGSIIRTWKQSYNIVKQDKSWLFLLSTMHRDV